MATFSRPRSAAPSSSRFGVRNHDQRPSSRAGSETCAARGDKLVRTLTVKPTSAASAALVAVAEVGPSAGIAQAVWALKGPAFSKSASAPTLATCSTSKGRPDSKGSQGVARSASHLLASPSAFEEIGRSSSKHAAEMHNLLADQLASRKFEKVRDELCEGLRVLILGQKAPPIVLNARAQAWQTSSPPHHKQPATAEQAIKIYKFFWTLLRQISRLYELQPESYEAVAANDNVCTTPLLDRSHSQLKSDGYACSSLPEICWGNIITWATLEAQMSNCARHKSVAVAFLRALKSWRQDHVPSTPHNSGVSLIMLLRWTWPHANNSDVADILSWICFHELEKISFPEPPVIEISERRRLVDLFHLMDSSKSGFCSSEDIAGGERPDETKNIPIDAPIVEAVCGKGMKLNTFLEMMCEDNFRGHAASTRVFLQDGRRLVRHSIKTIGFKGWVLDDEDATGHDQTTRKVIEALEAQVRRLRSS